MAKPTAPGTTNRPYAAESSWQREGKWRGIRWAAGLRLREMAATYPGSGTGPSRMMGAHELVGAPGGERFQQRDIQQQLDVWESEGGAIGGR
jgi:hypothetical protein